MAFSRTSIVDRTLQQDCVNNISIASISTGMPKPDSWTYDAQENKIVNLGGLEVIRPSTWSPIICYSRPLPSIEFKDISGLAEMKDGHQLYDSTHKVTRRWTAPSQAEETPPRTIPGYWKSEYHDHEVYINDVNDLAPWFDEGKQMYVLEHKHYHFSRHISSLHEDPARDLKYGFDVTQGPSLFNLAFVYSGTGPLFYTAQQYGKSQLLLDNIFVSARDTVTGLPPAPIMAGPIFAPPNNSCSVFDMRGAGSAQNIITMRNAMFLGFNSLGVIHNYLVALLFGDFMDFNFGLTLDGCDGAFNSVYIYKLVWGTPSPRAFVRFEGTSNGYAFLLVMVALLPNDYIFDFDPAIAISNFAGTSMMVAKLSPIMTGYFLPGSLTKYDPRFTFKGCASLEDTLPRIQLSYGGTGLTMVMTEGFLRRIPISSMTQSITIERFALDLNSARYTGLETAALVSNANVSLRVASGTNIVCATLLLRVYNEAKACTFEVANEVKCVGHGLNIDDGVKFYGDVTDAGLDISTVYFVRSATADTFTLNTWRYNATTAPTKAQKIITPYVGTGATLRRAAPIDGSMSTDAISSSSRPCSYVSMAMSEWNTGDSLEAMAVNITNGNSLIVVQCQFTTKG